MVQCLACHAALYRRLELEIAREMKMRTCDLRCIQVFDLDQRVPVKSLIRSLGLSSSRISRILDRLEDSHYLKREIDSADRRGIIVHLTAKGDRLLQSLKSRIHQAYEPALSAIAATDARRLVELLNELGSHLSGRFERRNPKRNSLKPLHLKS